MKNPLKLLNTNQKSGYSVDYRIKKGGLIGLTGAVTVYYYASWNGFNRASFLLMLYMFIIVGVLSSLQASDLNIHSSLNKVLIVANEEENRLKRIFTGEEYRIDGTVEKV